jgi:hypothetical protein
MRNVDERQKIIAAVARWQRPSAWKAAFRVGVKFREAKAAAAANRELSIKNPASRLWAMARDANEEEAERYRKRAIRLHGELLAIENYLRRNAPDLFPLVPIVNFLFDDPPDDMLPLAERMRQIESALRVRLAQGGGAGEDKAAESPNETAAPRKGKRRTKWGEAEAILIAALLKHHRYGGQDCLNLTPIRTSALAKLTGISQSRTWNFFAENFDGPANYREICSRPKELADALKLLASRLATAQQLPYSEGRASHLGEA